MKISFSGDMCLNDVGKVRIGAGLEEVLNRNEHNVLNLEAPFLCTGCQPIVKSGPAISQSEQVAPFLKKAGWDLVSLANNHIMDYAPEALIHTLKSLEDNEISHFGAGDYPQAYSPLVVVGKTGFRLGIIAATHREFGVVTDEDSSEKGAAWICAPEMAKIILKVRPTVDALVLFAHAGVENMSYPLPEWRKVYRNFIDLGCDAVVASHPHVPQGWEIYNDRPIVYSLGNLCFQLSGGLVASGGKPLWNTGLVCELEFSSLGTRISDMNIVRYEPDQGLLDCCSIFGSQSEVDSLGNTSHRRNVGDIQSTGVIKKNDDIFSSLDDIKTYIYGLNTILEDSQAYYNAVEQQLTEMWPQYQKLFANSGLVWEPFSGAMLLKFKRALLGPKYSMAHLLNNLQNESHRWAIERILRHQL